MQSVDYTTLKAICHSLRQILIPSRVEQIYQWDTNTIALCLRSLKQKHWLKISWHPQGARICIGESPPRQKDTFTLSEQLRHLINGYALIGIEIVTDWERVIEFSFAQRPNESPLYHLYVEIVGKYSNVILTNSHQQIITVAKQVKAHQSTMRTVETGQIYQFPPSLQGDTPKLSESREKWQDKISLIPGKIEQQLIKTYRGVSPIIAKLLLEKAQIDPNKNNQELTLIEWEKLYHNWQWWLSVIKDNQFYPYETEKGYSVLGTPQENQDINKLLNNYYNKCLYKEKFDNLKQQLQQKVKNNLKKITIKKDKYELKIKESDNSEQYSKKADLLMAYSHLWQPGMKEIELKDFETEEIVKIKLSPDKNMIQNAQVLYKQYQKLKRAKIAVQPLLNETISEVNYLQQILTNLSQLNYTETQDLTTLEEIKAELIQQKYIEDSQYRVNNNSGVEESQPRIYQSPSGYQVLVGRNNRQNDILTFRTATDYDLWFHAQEISGSHVLLRLSAGDIPEETDLQFTANLAAYYSQGRESEQVPVVYTNPSQIHKPKGAKPGMVIYTKERIIWGKPLQLKS